MISSDRDGLSITSLTSEDDDLVFQARKVVAE